MKTSIHWLIIALLLGGCLFGVYKSLELQGEKDILGFSLADFKDRLTKAQDSLKEAKQSLAESYLANTKLGEEAGILKARVAKSEKALQEHKEQISFLSGKLKEASQVNVSLLKDHNKQSAQLFRLELENAQMKQTLSSVQELKKTIRELKRSKKSRPQEAKEAAAAAGPGKRLFGRRPSADDTIQSVPHGNKGFFVRDGKPTIEEMVEIQVVPAEPNTL